MSDQDPLEGGSALRFDEGHFFASLQDDYCLPVPSHPPELDRLEYLHDIYKSIIGTVPADLSELLSDGSEYRVLDVGCGTGKWALEIAQGYPSTSVLGLDLVDSPVAIPPDNCRFHIHDFSRGLPCEDDSVDVVHLRDLLLGMHDYPGLLAECARVLKSGGYLLVVEVEYAVKLTDGSEIDENCPSISRVLSDFRDALTERGLDPWLAYRLDTMVQSTEGLYTVDTGRHTIPLTAWSKGYYALGSTSHAAFDLFLDSARIMLQDHGVMDYSGICAGAREELGSNAHGTVWVFDSVVARKA